MKKKHLANDKLHQRFLRIKLAFFSGKKQEALAEASCLASQYPDDYRIRVLRGFLTAEQGDAEVGIAELEEACRQAPHDAWALRTLGEVLYKAGDYDQALVRLQAADSLKPDDEHTLLFLGNTLLDSGQSMLAWSYYQKALALNPFSIELLFNAAPFIHFKDPADPRILFLHQQLDESQLIDEKRSTVHFTLGKVYQDLQQPQKAFQHYQQANELLLLQRQPDADLEPVLADLHAFYTPAIQQVLAKLGLPAHQEVLIIGVSRSGKSLLESLLACHPSVTPGGEDLTFYKTAAQFTSETQGPLRYLRQITPEKVREHAQVYIKQRQWPATPYLTNTLPSNLYLLNIYAVWFPTVPVIFVKRHYEDQGLACYFKQYKQRHAFSNDLYATGREIAFSERLMDFWSEHLPNPCLQIHYEDLVQKPAATTRLVYRFLGLDWQPDYFADLKNHKTQVNHLAPHQSLDGSASLRQDYIGWSKVYAEHLEPLKRGYQEAMQRVFDTEQINVEKDDLVNRLHACQHALKNHSYIAAAKLAQRLLKSRPDQSQFLQLAGISNSMIGNDQQALVFFSKAEDFSKNDLGLTINHIRALLRAQDFNQATRRFDLLQQQHPQHAAVQQLGVQILLESGSKHKKQLQEALLKTDHLLVQQSIDPELLLLKAGLLHRLGQREASLQQYQQLLQQLAQLPSNEAWRSAPLKTRVLLAYAQLQADVKQPDAAVICEVLWQAASQHPLSRTSVTCWVEYKKWLQRSKKPEHKVLNRLHLKVAGIWQHYATDELEHSFGDYGLPSQSFEPLQLPGTRPAVARLEAYGLAKLLPAKARALDIGCTYGYLLLGLADQLSAGVGFDISKACIEVGQAVAEHLGVSDRIHLQHSTFDEFCQQPQQPYDLILACAVHHWINKPLPQFGRILYDWVKPGGLVLVESQGSRQRDATEPDFDTNVAQMMQPGFVCIAQGSLCDDEINYREFRVLQRPINAIDTLED